MKALVTGGAGFIGSHIVERLLKDENDVVVLDNFYTGKESNLSFVKDLSLDANRYTLIKGDIRDKDTCKKACSGVDVVFHQAALRSVPKSLENPHDYNAVNIDGILNVLEAAKERGVKRFVFASSSSAYGDVDVFPQKEDFYPALISPYALSKLAGEYYCRIYSEHYGMDTIALRYFNVFGPRQALDDEYAVVIPKFIDCILHDRQPPIFGNGKQSRDFTYIDNVVRANILAATVDLPEMKDAHRSPLSAKHYVLNVANGADNTVLSLVDAINKITGKSIKPTFEPVRAGDVFRTCADISKIRAVLGFDPRVSFEEGLKKTVEYWKNNEA